MRLTHVFLFLICSIFLLPVYSQTGCTDVLAMNFSPNAKINDGSCQYGDTIMNLERMVILEEGLKENSGLLHLHGKTWTHNDSGGENALYELDPKTGKAKRKVVVKNAKAADWEDVAASPTHVFIGDFGNNKGKRKNLRIYAVKKKDLVSKDSVTAYRISFAFEDQTVFEGSKARSFDCEAFFFHNDSLHLFTKDWINLRTSHYVIPTTKGKYIAKKKTEFDVNGMLTGADISSDGKTVVLLGYNTQEIVSFVWVLWDFKDGDYFSGNKRKLHFGFLLTTGQVEGITFSEGKKGLISSEAVKKDGFPQVDLPPYLYIFDLQPWIEPHKK